MKTMKNNKRGRIFIFKMLMLALFVSVIVTVLFSVSSSAAEYENVVPTQAAANKAVDLIVNGVQVTDSTGAATANISDATAGWSYDAETNTLTLENAVIDTVSSKSAGIYYNGGDLIIKLIGESRIDVRNPYNGAIFTSITPYINAADLYIVGDGSLETSGQIQGYDGSLSISGGAVLKVPRLYYDEVSIIESSIVANGTEQAIFGSLNITITKSNIKVDGNSSGIVTNGTLNISDSEITINATNGISMKEQPFEIVNSVIDVTSSDTTLFANASGTITNSFVKLHSENYSALDIDNEALTIRNSQVLGTSGTGMSNSANESLTDSLYQDNNTVALSGNVTLIQSAELPSAATLIIPEGSTLTVPENVELSALCGIENNGSVVVNGTIVLPDTMSKDDVLPLGITGAGTLKFGDAHIDADGNCITHNYIAVSKNETHHYTQVCSVCRTVNEEIFAEHTFADGVCTLCSYACVHTTHNAAGVCDTCRKQRGYSVTVGDSVSYFDDMYEAFGATKTGTEQNPATIKLLTNVTHTTWRFGTVSKGAYVVLDLNGYTLTFTHEDTGIQVVGGSHFTLMDSSDGETGSIVGDYEEQYPTGSHLIRVSEQSTMILQGGRLVLDIYAAEAIHVIEASTLIQNGGVIEGTAFVAVSVRSGSLFTQNGGTIISNGYAVGIEDDGSRYVLEGGTLFLNGNWATMNGGYFDFYESDGTVTINGGIFDAVGASDASISAPTLYMIGRGAYGDCKIIINAATFKKADNTALYITDGCYDGTITIQFKNVVFENGLALYYPETQTLGEYLAPGYIYYDENGDVITLTEGMTALTGKITVAECTNHTGGTATCTTLAVCTLCKLEYGTYYHADDNGDIFCDVCGGLPITEAAFPDAIFCTYIAENIDTDGDGLLSPDEIEAVTVIDISYKSSYSYTNISDLTGIKYFKNLVTLDASGTKIASIDVSVFADLEFLYLFNCHYLKTLDLTANTNLMDLDVSGTGLTELDLSHNSNAGLRMGENTSVVTLEHCGMGYIDMSWFGDTERMTILSGGTLGEDGRLKLDAGATKVVYEYDTKSNPQIAAYFYVEVYINSNNVTHTYVANTTSKNETQHYTEVCTICRTGNEEALEDHTDGNTDHLCDACGEAVSQCADDNNDHKCDTCGAVLSECTGGTATCRYKAICDICGELYGELNPNNHQGTNHTTATNGNGTHNIVWACCNEVVTENVPCISADCTKQSSCACGYKLSAINTEHDFSGEYVYNDDYHWKKCADCEKTDTKSYHEVSDDGDCTTPVLCACGCVFMEAKPSHIDEDKNGLCDFCMTMLTEAIISQVSVTLEGDIGVNFYWMLSDSVTANSSAYFLVSLPNGESEKILITNDLIDSPVGDYSGNIYYKVTGYVAAKEMSEDIRVELFLNGECIKSAKCSVKGYAERVFAYEYADENIVFMMKKMLNYGAASQLFFKHNTESLANNILSDEDKLTAAVDVSQVVAARIEGDGITGIIKEELSCILETKTAIRHYFSLSEGVTLDSYTFMIEGTTVAPVKTERNGKVMYYVEIPNISAKDMGVEYAFTISNGELTETVYASVHSYMNSVIRYSSDQALIDTVNAMYAYNQAAVAYFSE